MATAFPEICVGQGIRHEALSVFPLLTDSHVGVLTCEERDNLGVFWYENPTR
jgi:hypothetical protein